MKPAAFRYHTPTSETDVVTLLSDFGDDAKVLAGGQSLIPILAMRLSQFAHVIDLRKVPGLRRVERDGTDTVIGAMTTQAMIERSAEIAAELPLLVEATRLIGHAQIRSRGTIGGSMAHADPAAEYPTVARVLDARFDVVGPSGRRQIPAEEFFSGTWTTSLEPAEIVTAVRFESWGERSAFAVREVARRHGDFALAGVACGVQVADGRVTRCAIGMFAMDSTPVRAGVAERELTGSSVEGLQLDEIGRSAVEDLDPPGDIHARGEHRKRIGAVLVARALGAALEEVGHGG